MPHNPSVLSGVNAVLLSTLAFHGVLLLSSNLPRLQVLEQLKAVDLWGRSVLTHALLSGHEMMFEAAYGAVRDEIQDEQVGAAACQATP